MRELVPNEFPFSGQRIDSIVPKCGRQLVVSGLHASLTKHPENAFRSNPYPLSGVIFVRGVYGLREGEP